MDPEISEKGKFDSKFIDRMGRNETTLCRLARLSAIPRDAALSSELGYTLGMSVLCSDILWCGLVEMNIGDASLGTFISLLAWPA